MRKNLFPSAVVVLIGIQCWTMAARGEAPPPATAPVAPAPVADDPAVKEIRDTMIGWNKECAGWPLEKMRKLLYTENEREAMYADYIAHEGWEQGKTQKAVRDKWGAEAEAKFAHLTGSDTIEDDQVADITIDGNHATVAWKVKEISTTPMIKVDGKWLIDMHKGFEETLKENPDAEKQKVNTVPIMKQAAEDIAGGKYDDADAFIADIKSKLETNGGN